MSYDLELVDRDTGEVLRLSSVHHMRGSTYVLGGTNELSLSITYNYSPHYVKTIGKGGLRTLAGLTGRESLPILTRAIDTLKHDVNTDYWHPSEGNARKALMDLWTMATCKPDGVWRVS